MVQSHAFHLMVLGLCLAVISAHGSYTLTLTDPATNTTCLIMEFGTLQYSVEEYGFNTSYPLPPLNSSTADFSILLTNDSSTAPALPVSACPIRQDDGSYVAILTLEITYKENQTWTCDNFLPDFLAAECPFAAGSRWQNVSRVAISFEFTGKATDTPFNSSSSQLPEIVEWETSFIQHSLSYGRCVNESTQYSTEDGQLQSCTTWGPSGPISEDEGAGAFRARRGFGLTCNRTVTLGWPKPESKDEYIWIAELTDFNMQPFNVNGTEIRPAPEESEIEVCEDKDVKKHRDGKPVVLGLGFTVVGVGILCVLLVVYIMSKKHARSHSERTEYERLEGSTEV